MRCKKCGAAELFEDDGWCACATGETNGDRIRTMSNEELANFLACADCWSYCRAKMLEDCGELNCKQGILDWLNSEEEEGKEMRNG